MEQKGIAVAGNMIVDNLYPVENLPGPGELTTILGSASRSTGGAVCNVLMDLASMDSSLPLCALGRLGRDEAGNFVFAQMNRFPNIELSHIKREGETSFTMVMSCAEKKERTFYQYRGANALFSEADIDWDSINPNILHVGYILLLDALDKEDNDYGTAMARLLCHAQERGVKTSIDVVSEAGSRFRKVVAPALKYTDYCIINELEAEQITGIQLREKSGILIKTNLSPALKKLQEMGVRRWAVIHYPEGACGIDQNGEIAFCPSVELRPERIKGKTGAGDAFCAGVLWTANDGGSLESALRLGSFAAAASLLAPGAAEGMRPIAELRTMFQGK